MNANLEFYITGDRLSRKEKQAWEKIGCYGYDLRYDGFNEDTFIHEFVLINHVGSIITTKNLDLDSINNRLPMSDVEKKGEEMKYEKFNALEIKVQEILNEKDIEL